MLLTSFLLSSSPLAVQQELVCDRYISTVSNGTYTNAARKVGKDSAGNTYLSLVTDSTLDVYLMKLEATTNAILWQKKITGTANDEVFGLYTSANGTTSISGRTIIGATSDAFVAVFDTNGNLLWQKIIALSGTETAYGTFVDSSGNVYATGQQSGGSGFLVKFDPSGTLLWQKYISIGSTTLWGVCVDSYSNVYVTGGGNSPSYCGHLLKFDSTGNLLWQKKWSNGYSTYGTSVQVDSSDSPYLSGYVYIDGSTYYDGFVMKFNSSGTFLWGKRFNVSSTLNSVLYTINVTPDGYVYAGGASQSYASKLDALLVKLDQNGNVLNQLRVHGDTVTSNEYIFGTNLDSAGNIDFIGTSYSAAQDVIFGKIGFDSSGKFGKYYVSPINLNVYLSGVLTQADGDAAVSSGIATISSGAMTLSSGTLTAYKEPACEGDSSVDVLMHFNGNLTDEVGHMVSNSGVSFSSTNKFGSHSASFSSGNTFTIESCMGFQANVPFTIEFFMNTTTAPSNYMYFYCAAGNQNFMASYQNNAGTYWLNFTLQGIGIAQPISGPIHDGNWHHIALVRDSIGLAKIYLDGVQQGSYSDIPSYAHSAENVMFGKRNDSYMPYTGLIDEFRYTKGVARYTSNFTPPTAAFPNPTDPYFSSVTLLMHMEGANNGTTFTDEKAHTVTASGNAVTSTTQKKFGGTAAYFDGNGDFLNSPPSSDWSFPGDFTVEGWVYRNVNDTYYFVSTADQFNYSNGPGWSIAHSATTITFTWNSGTAWDVIDTYTGLTIPNNQWVHLAVTRASGVMRVFVNGTVGGSTFTRTQNFVSTNKQLSIGSLATVSGPGNWNMYGYIDEVRITKGVARYTANFIPPTTPFPNQ